ncbi:MAG: S1 family peptidase [Pseudomonadota bacterium]
MYWRISFLAFLLFLSTFSAVRSGASEFFPSGSCAVVVASRESLSEARQWIVANDWENSARVFLSDNGWYAISVAEVRLDAAEKRLSAGKEAGAYPVDAYCSTGQRYVREIAWARAETPRPPSERLWDEFDARPLTRSEKAFLQSSLALQGAYNGLLDGVWGSGSQSALERFTRGMFDREPLNADAAYLSMLMFDAIGDAGWQRHVVDNLAISIILPLEMLALNKSEGTYQEWEHKTKDIAFFFDDFQTSAMTGVHDEFAMDPDLVEPPYLVRNEDFWVTSGILRGATFYARSDLIQGTWSTSVIFAGAAHASELALITSSIQPNSMGLFLPEENGRLVGYTDTLLEVLEGSAEEESVAPSTSADPAEPGREYGTGTGFLINREGVYLTNAHVIENCSSLRLDGLSAEVVAVSKSFDLAALRTPTDNIGTPLFFSENEVGLNADVTIAGFPLHGLLGGLNVSRGSVSSMKGIGGDETNVQISAPVQPGNSGGPMIDRNGNVVGVVVAKLDAVEVANATGDIAQNVNFAIRGSIAKIFLQTNGIEYSLGANQTDLSPEDAARILQSATKLIECGAHE